jgi:hypothetical protein
MTTIVSTIFEINIDAYSTNLDALLEKSNAFLDDSNNTALDQMIALTPNNIAIITRRSQLRLQPPPIFNLPLHIVISVFLSMPAIIANILLAIIISIRSTMPSILPFHSLLTTLLNAPLIVDNNYTFHV